MRATTMLFFSFFVCNFAQAGLLKNVVDVPYLKKITDMVAGKKQTGYSLAEFIRFTNYGKCKPFQSRIKDFDHQCACMYILLAEEKQNQETGVYAHQRKAIAYLALYSTDEFEKPYIFAQELVAKEERPWEKNLAPDYDFLKKP